MTIKELKEAVNNDILVIVSKLTSQLDKNLNEIYSDLLGNYKFQIDSDNRKITLTFTGNLTQWMKENNLTLDNITEIINQEMVSLLGMTLYGKLTPIKPMQIGNKIIFTLTLKG